MALLKSDFCYLRINTKAIEDSIVMRTKHNRVFSTVAARALAAFIIVSVCFALILYVSGCAGFESWKSERLSELYRSDEAGDKSGVVFTLVGEHSVIGVGANTVREDREKWKATFSMSSLEMQRGADFHLDAKVKIVDKEILRLIEKSGSDELYMLAVIAPIYNREGHFRQFTNIQMSCMLTPTGMPIETLQENLPAKFKSNHYRTPWEMVDTRTPAEAIDGDVIRFSIDSRVPGDIDDGHYRIAIEMGARIDGRLIKLELIPYLGSILLDEEKSRDVFLTANATERSRININYSPVFTVGAPAPPRMPWTLLGTVDTHGTRGIVAREDKAYFAISYSGLRQDKMIIPMNNRYGAPITYRLEPDFPTQNKEQESFEKTYYYKGPTVLSHIQLSPVELDYSSGEMSVVVHTPSGGTDDLGRAPFIGNTKTGATTGGNYFDYRFSEYGHYVIEMKGYINDVFGRTYFGGGTYDVWVALPLSMSTSCKPGMPYSVGMSYSPRVTVHPGVPADMSYEVKLYRNSSKEDVKVWKHTGRANNYGYYFPRENFEPMVFDAPGEYRAEVTATYWDKDGRLWMGGQTSASVVATRDSDVTVHGDIMFFQSRPFDVNVPLDFRPRFELRASGLAGTQEINDMTMTQIRMGMPYNSNDVLFFSPALLWNVGEMYPLLSFSTTDRSVTGEVLNNFPPLDRFLNEHFGETIDDLNDCWGKVYAVDTCDSMLLDMVETSLHKAADNLTVMSMGANRYQPHAFQEDQEIVSYYYSSSIKPGLLSRNVVSDSTNSTSYWIITPNFFGHQFGSGENGDVRGDLYHLMGGVVYRNLKTGVNKYGIYHSSALVADGRDENNRVEAPLKSPLVTVGGRDYYMFPGMSPEQGAIYETGDKIVSGGFLFPSISADYEFRLVPPSGKPLIYKGKSNDFGLFKPMPGYIAREPGLYRVYMKFFAGGREGATLGKPDGWYHLYVVEENSPYKITFDMPLVSEFDPKDVLELHGSLPEGWKDGKLYYTVVSPGVVYSDGELPIEDGRFTYRYAPLHANVYYKSLELFDKVNNRPDFWDTVVFSFFVDGVSRDGKRITAAAEILARGNKVYYFEGEWPKGPPPKLRAKKMYGRFSIDRSAFPYSKDDIKVPGDTGNLIKKKCGSCHALPSAGRTFSAWSGIVNWHIEKNWLWLRPANRRAIVDALYEKFPPSTSDDAAMREKMLMQKGDKLFKKRCLSCHPSEPARDRPRSRLGWKNIIERHEYWGEKMRGDPMYANDEEKKTLFEYLHLVSGSEPELPAGDPRSPKKKFQKLCFDCHATTLETYNWSKADRRFLDMHIKNKFDAGKQHDAEAVLKYLLGDDNRKKSGNEE